MKNKKISTIILLITVVAGVCFRTQAMSEGDMKEFARDYIRQYGTPKAAFSAALSARINGFPECIVKNFGLDINFALSAAAANSKHGTSVIQACLDKGAYINACNERGETPFMTSLKARNHANAMFLLSKGADITITDHTGTAPHMAAAQAGFKDIVQLCLAKGADLNAKNHKGETALQHAVVGKHLGLTQDLLEQGADPRQGHVLHAAISASRNKNVPKLLGMLMEAGADENEVDEEGKTALDRHRNVRRNFDPHGKDVGLYTGKEDRELGRKVTQQLLSKKNAPKHQLEQPAPPGGPSNKIISRRQLKRDKKLAQAMEAQARAKALSLSNPEKLNLAPEQAEYDGGEPENYKNIPADDIGEQA